jgi:hypothetical protein
MIAERVTIGIEVESPDGSPLEVTFCKNWMGGNVHHFELRGLCVSPTGYRSHFVHGEIPDPAETATALVAQLFRQRRAEGYKPGQTSLF